jgi:site-specific recombinase XerD
MASPRGLRTATSRRCGTWAEFTRRSPYTVKRADLTRYFEHLVLDRHLAPASVRLIYHGVRFLCRQVLAWPTLELEVTLPRRPQRIPGLLARAEVAAILGACAKPRERTMLTLCYGCGLRLSELFALRVADIDGELPLLRITQGKGARVAADCGVKGLPTSFAVDPKGRVILRAVGGTELDDPAAIEQLLPYPSAP